jgi:hypothetical protein
MLCGGSIVGMGDCCVAQPPSNIALANVPTPKRDKKRRITGAPLLQFEPVRARFVLYLI